MSNKQQQNINNYNKKIEEEISKNSIEEFLNAPVILSKEEQEFSTLNDYNNSKIHTKYNSETIATIKL